MAESKNAGTRLLEVFPAAPYLAFGALLAWTSIAFSSFLTLPGIEVGEPNIAFMNIASGFANGLTLIAAAIFLEPAKKLLKKPLHIFLCGAVTSIICALILAVEPLGLPPVARQVFLVVLYATTGATTALIFLKIGALYGNLPARKAVLYLAWSHVLAAGIFFVTIGMYGWSLFNLPDAASGCIAFVLLPAVAAVGAILLPQAGAPNESEDYAESKRALPPSFWKLLVVIFVLSFVMQIVNSSSIAINPTDSAFANSRLNNFLRIIIGFALAWSAATTSAEHFKLGKVYTLIMVISIIFVTILPVMRSFFEGWGQLAGFVMLLFRILHWVVLSLIVCQKRISPILVFGFGAGVQTLGSGIGTIAGSYYLHLFTDTTSTLIICVTLTAIVIVCAFLLFSEKDFDKLFEPADDSENTLIDMFGDTSFPVMNYDTATPVIKANFTETIEFLSTRYRLSNRETEVFRCLAMGFNASMISEKLCISWNTVRGHSRNVYTKLDVHSRQELMELVEAAKIEHAESK